MRISDWSSDVCSSDLARRAGCHVGIELLQARATVAHRPEHRDACARCYRNRLDLDGAADDRAIRVIEERPAGAEGAAFQPDIVEAVFAACRVIKEIRRAAGRERVSQYV